jgi:hypothetical protein
MKTQTTSKTAERAREEAELAATLLAQSPSKVAVLLAADWQVRSIPFVFEHLAQYEGVAAGSGWSLITVKRDDFGGFEHLLFMTRLPGLADDQYLDCLDGNTPLDYTLPPRKKP